MGVQPNVLRRADIFLVKTKFCAFNGAIKEIDTDIFETFLLRHQSFTGQLLVTGQLFQLSPDYLQDYNCRVNQRSHHGVFKTIVGNYLLFSTTIFAVNTFNIKKMYLNLNMFVKLMMIISMTLISHLTTQVSAAPIPLFFNLAQGLQCLH